VVEYTLSFQETLDSIPGTRSKEYRVGDFLQNSMEEVMARNYEWP
jgi:hypothetical protein